MGDRAAEQARTEEWLGRPGVAAGLWLVVTIVLTWPLAARVGDALPAGAGDLWQNVWNFWWWDQALAAGESPWRTPFLWHPQGADLSLHTHSPFNMLLLSRLADPVTAYGLAVLGSTWLAALGAFLLGRELAGSARAGVVAGLVFAFFPNRLEQTLEHLNLFSSEFLPLTVWAYVRLVRTGKRRWIAALGVFFAANALCDWQLAILALLPLGGLAVHTLWRPPRARAAIVRDVALAGALAAVLVLPFARPVIDAIGSGAAYQKPAVEKGVDLAFLLRPHFHHPLFGSLTREAYLEHRAYPSAGFTAYLGVAALALAASAVARRREGAGLWAALFVVSVVLALGAHAHVNGRLLASPPLPFAGLASVPGLATLRVANRFLIPGSLALAVLAALAIGRRPTGRGFGVALLAVGIDTLWLPYPLAAVEPQPVYAALRAGELPGAVLNLPFTDSPAAVGAMRAQLQHGRPIAGGYVSVPSARWREFLAREPALRDLYGLAPRLAAPLDVSRLRALGFGVILLHLDRRAGAPGVVPDEPLLGSGLYRLGEMSAAHFDAAQRRIEAACGPPFYVDARVAAYALPAPE